jgi:CheY-like chemotaxis protein
MNGFDRANETCAATVLVVDDDAAVRTVLQRWIRGLGYQVAVAPGADAAMAMLREWPFDVAVCDVRMPGHDGVWLVDHIRREHPHTSVVLATGLAKLDPHLTLRSGVTGYIVKPFDREELADALQVAIDDCRTRAAHDRHARPAPPAVEGADTPKRLAAQNVVDGVVIDER